MSCCREGGQAGVASHIVSHSHPNNIHQLCHSSTRVVLTFIRCLVIVPCPFSSSSYTHPFIAHDLSQRISHLNPPSRPSVSLPTPPPDSHTLDPTNHPPNQANESTTGHISQHDAPRPRTTHHKTGSQALQSGPVRCVDPLKHPRSHPRPRHPHSAQRHVQPRRVRNATRYDITRSRRDRGRELVARNDRTGQDGKVSSDFPRTRWGTRRASGAVAIRKEWSMEVEM